MRRSATPVACKFPICQTPEFDVQGSPATQGLDILVARKGFHGNENAHFRHGISRLAFGDTRGATLIPNSLSEACVSPSIPLHDTAVEIGRQRAKGRRCPSGDAT